ncbi:MAG: sigma-70 family RNA polymerase sigma factor [Phycisphaerales bacterium]|nr:sigma-70 family RNA polymerase sigma factor [Phycisphaerales bacterium]
MARGVQDSQQGPTTAVSCRAIRAGDAAAFTRLYEATFDRLLARAKRCTKRDEQFCLDVVQEVFVKVIKRLPILESEAALHAWLDRATVTTAYDALRRDIRRARREEGRVEGDAARAASSDVETKEQLDWLARELAEMDAGVARRVMARHRDGKAMEDLTSGSARGRVYRAMEALRERARRAFNETGGRGVL